MWLLKTETFDAMRVAHQTGAGPTAEAQEAHIKSEEATIASMGPRNLSIADGVAEIRIEGVLTPKPDLWARWFGGGNTTYGEISSAIAQAEADPSVKRISYFIDSPGGYVKGMFEALEAVRAAKKPSSVRTPCACSAAYAFAAAGGPILATTEASEIGSIGVAASFVKWADMEVIDITSSNAPDKRPDPFTEEGQKVIRKQLDDIEDLLISGIARDRNKSTQEVKENFARGGVVLAREAKKLGMVDSVARRLNSKRATDELEPSAVAPAPLAADDQGPKDLGTGEPAPVAAKPAAQTPKSGRTRSMDKAQLKKENRELYDEILEEGRAIGEASERKRVKAHLTMGEKSGAMDIATKAILEGTEFGVDVQADYMGAALDKRDIDNRRADDKQTSDAITGRSSDNTEGQDLGDKVVALLAAKRGVDLAKVS